ncbi:MAG: hypothetical protein JEZ12_12935 [Desulfobacterium sp.]|nr:hypothetical protein [Desulfobacterium sp.]
MIYRADWKEAEAMAGRLQQKGMSQDEAWEEIRISEVCTCRKLMRRNRDLERWVCACGRSRMMPALCF